MTCYGVVWTACAVDEKRSHCGLKYTLYLIETCVVTEFAFTCRPRKLSVIFGSAKASFKPEWRRQGFSFCNLCELDYCIVQLKVTLVFSSWWD